MKKSKKNRQLEKHTCVYYAQSFTFFCSLQFQHFIFSHLLLYILFLCLLLLIPSLQCSWASRLSSLWIVGLIQWLNPIQPKSKIYFIEIIFLTNLIILKLNNKYQTKDWKVKFDIVVISSSKISNEWSKDEVWYWNKWD